MDKFLFRVSIAVAIIEPTLVYLFPHYIGSFMDRYDGYKFLILINLNISIAFIAAIGYYLVKKYFKGQHHEN